MAAPPCHRLNRWRDCLTVLRPANPKHKCAEVKHLTLMCFHVFAVSATQFNTPSNKSQSTKCDISQGGEVSGCRQTNIALPSHRARVPHRMERQGGGRSPSVGDTPPVPGDGAVDGSCHWRHRHALSARSSSKAGSGAWPRPPSPRLARAAVLGPGPCCGGHGGNGGPGGPRAPRTASQCGLCATSGHPAPTGGCQRQD